MMPHSFAGVTGALADFAPALANHLWQSTLFVVVAGVLTLALRKNHARARYWIWMAASVKFLIPFALLIAVGSHLAKPHATAATQAGMYFAMEDVSEPFALPALPVLAAPVAKVDWAALLPAVCGVAWLGGFVAVLCLWTMRWRRIAAEMREAVAMREGRELDALRRLERASGVGARIRLLQSPSAMEPGVFGIARPVLAWPARISERLDDAHLAAVLAHEVCHVRRRDNLTAAIHMVVEAVFWFYPPVWWLGARLVEERERACDEEVLELCKQPEVYAESILKVCEFCVESPLACVSGVTGADLKQRIVEIMTERVVRKLGPGRKLLLVAVGLAVVAVPIVLGQVKAAHRMMLAAVDAAPMPFRTAAHEMLALEETPSSGLIAEMQAGAAIETANPTGDDKAATNGAPGYVSTMTFDVASVRESKQDLNLPHKVGGGLSPHSSNLRIENVQLYYLLSMAYGVHDHQIEGLPNWGSTSYNIQAKSDSAADEKLAKLSDKDALAEKQHMMQALLAERFKLKAHWETRKGPVYNLVVAKRGSKLHAGGSMPPSVDELKRFGDTKIPDLYQRGDGRRGYEWIGHDCDIASLSSILSALMRTTVLDKTGLSGTYDFDLQYSNSPDSEREVDHTIWPRVSDAVEDQLGMKLVPAKGQVQVLVVDHVEKPTSVDGAEVVQRSATPVGALSASISKAQQPQQAKSLQFEVATIKQGDPKLPANSHSSGGGPGGLYRMENTPLKQWVEMGLSVSDYALKAPSWLDTSRFDLVARLPTDKPDDHNATAEMMKSLLIQRFGLKWHEETQTVSGYELVADKKVLLKPASLRERLLGGGAGWGPATVNGTNMTMSAFAETLGKVLGRPVVDATHLSGGFDISLIWLPDNDAAVAEAKQHGMNNVNNLPSIFTAVREQLGLRLQSAKVPSKIIVVDNINRQPTEN
jgi:uncharacterized protein (TIGR03435 family)